MTFQLPGTGDVATVDTSVLLDVTSVTVRQIHVVGSGRLIISDNVGDITITADGILVKVTHFLVKVAYFLVKVICVTCFIVKVAYFLVKVT